MPVRRVLRAAALAWLPPALLLAAVVWPTMAQAVPLNTAPPTIQGEAFEGRILEDSPRGSWTSAAPPPLLVSTQWLRCDSTGGNCQAILGATGLAYTLTATDAGSTIRVEETVSNSEGTSAPVISAATPVVQAAGTASLNVAFVIAGESNQAGYDTVTVENHEATCVQFYFQSYDKGAPDSFYVEEVAAGQDIRFDVPSDIEGEPSQMQYFHCKEEQGHPPLEIVSFVFEAGYPKPTMTFAPAFSPSQFLGEGSSLETKFTFSGTEYHGSPDPVTEVVIHLPAGVGGSSAGFPTCSEQILAEVFGPGTAGCPAGSLAGPVGAIALDVEEGAMLPGEPTERIHETGTIQPVFASPAETSADFLFFIEAPGIQAIVPAYYVEDSPPYGRELRLELPLIETVPDQPYASITSLTVTLGASREEDGQLLSGLTIPQECPSSGKFPWAADVTYTTNEAFTEQTHEHMTAETVCPEESSKIVTSTTLQASTAAPHIGEAVSYTATVTPKTLGASLPSGSVTFLDAGQPIGGCTAQALVPAAASATASCQVSYPVVGTHQITARYGGDSGYFGSEASGQAITVSAVEPPHEAPKPTEVPAGSKLPLVSCCDGPAQRPVITVAQIKALLARQLTPTGKGAKIGALLKSGGYSESFQAPEAGILTVQWYGVPSGAKLAKAKDKPVLVAVGKLVFSTAGTGMLKVKLTTTGKKLLEHTKRVELEAKERFAPMGGGVVSLTKGFGLGR